MRKTGSAEINAERPPGMAETHGDFYIISRHTSRGTKTNFTLKFTVTFKQAGSAPLKVEKSKGKVK